MSNPFINIQRLRAQREWEQGQGKRQERAEYTQKQELYQNFFRQAIPLAQKVGPLVFRILNQLKFALYGNDRNYWVTHHILAIDTVMKTDFTHTDPQSILRFPSNEVPDTSFWPIGVWEIVQHFPGRLASQGHPHGYHDCLVSVAFNFLQNGTTWFSCRRFKWREICVVSEDGLVRCLAELCAIEEKHRKGTHRPRK